MSRRQGRFYGWAVRAAARGPAVMGAPRSGAANVLYGGPRAREGERELEEE